MDEGRTFPLPMTHGPAWEDRLTLSPGIAAAGGRATFLTIVTADRAGQARLFARSARACHPDARLVVLVAGVASPRVFGDLYDRVIAAEELSFDGLADMRFRYSLAELCFALKPWALRHLLDESIDGPIYYFDSDIELFSPLVEVEAALSRGANLVLTPHILMPGPDERRDKAFLRSGSFNAGFFAIAPTPASRAFVAWWGDRVRTGGTHDPLEGTYGDQKWLELAPAICDGVAVLRHPGYNFAYWNAHERPLRCLGGVWTAADWPLRFVHYSRWDLRQQDAEQYLAGFFVGEYQSFADIFSEYRQKVEAESLACGVPAAPAAPEVVPEVIRQAYARHASAVDGGASAVLAHAETVLNGARAAASEAPDLADLPMTLLCDEIWQRHADLRYRFAIDSRSGRIAYLRWLIETGAAQLGIPASFLRQARAVLERERVRELEAAGEAAEALPVPMLPDAGAAREAEHEQVRRIHDDIRLLVRANKALRRELQCLRVRRWRDEERIAELEKELADLRGRAGDAAAGSHRPAQDGLHGPRRPMLTGPGPFFERGFCLGEAAAIAGRTVRRRRNAPSGMLVFGPYIALPPGGYAATIVARLHQPLPLFAGFTVDVVHDRAQRVVTTRRFRLCPAVWRRCELPFDIALGEVAGDVEIRLWARRGTPLEVRTIELHRLPGETPRAAPSSPQHG